jgi:hypothetical protein
VREAGGEGGAWRRPPTLPAAAAPSSARLGLCAAAAPPLSFVRAAPRALPPSPACPQEEVLKSDFKGKASVDEAELVAKYMRLLRPCVDAHLAGLPAALDRVKEGDGGGAKKKGWFS